MLWRMYDDGRATKTLLRMPLGQRKRGRQRKKFLYNIEEDLRTIEVRAWRLEDNIRRRLKEYSEGG